MNKPLIFFMALLCSLGLAACVERPENEMVQEAARQGPAPGIEQPTQFEGIFKGFSGNSQESAVIEVGGTDRNYKVAKGAAEDLESLQEGDAVAFSTKEVNGREVIEYLTEK